jgi:hypothetical protein
MAVKKKPIKNSPKPGIPPTNAHSKWDEYLSTISFQMCPANDQFRDRLAIELVTWARENEDALILDDFYDMKGISHSDVYRWYENHDGLKQAFEVAKRLIGSRRERGALKGKYNATTIHMMMPHYSTAWRETEKWRSDLRKENEQQGNIKVMIETYPSSPIVPDKKKAE